jgi:hypothetical protein
VPRLCELYSGICLTTEKKSTKKISVRVAQYRNNEQYNTQKKNSCTKYDVTEQKRTQNTQQRKLSIAGK